METSINQVVIQRGGACERRMTQGGERWAAKQFIREQCEDMVARPTEVRTYFADLLLDSSSPTPGSLK